jgi:hypothetical protein
LASHKQHSHDLMANLEMAEEQSAQQIAAAHEKKKKKFSRPAGKKLAGVGSCGSLTHSKQKRVGPALCYSHRTLGAKAIKCDNTVALGFW